MEWLALVTTDDSVHEIWQYALTTGIVLFSWLPDTMHLLELGAVMDFLGCVVYWVMYGTYLTGPIETRVTYLHGRLVTAYNFLGTPQSERLSLGSLQTCVERAGAGPEAYPLLKEKAAIVRHACPAFKLVCDEICASFEHWSRPLVYVLSTTSLINRHSI